MKQYICIGRRVFVWFFLVAGSAWGQPVSTPGTGLPQALFRLREMDLHLHAGLERRTDLESWIHTMVADGRRVILLLDHLELYRKTPQELMEWNKKNQFPGVYPTGKEGRNALMQDFQEASNRRRDVILFRGWEVYEGELDTGLEPEPMDMAEVIGWHVSPRNGQKAPDGKDLIRRVKQIKATQNRFPVPMIVFHPFSMRLENLTRTAIHAGCDPKTLTVEECRFFQAGEQEELVRLLAGASIYIEMSLDHDKYWDHPAMQQAMMADIKPLAERGVQFTIATDHHSPASAAKSFHPERYCLPCGVDEANTNTIVRELLALRAKKSL